MQRAFLLAGAPEAGKSSLCAALLQHGRRVAKTQAPEFHGKHAVDLPGEYLVQPRFRNAFLACAEGAKSIIVVVSATKRDSLFPGDLLKVVPQTRIAGVISKIDAPHADVEAARKELASLGIREPVFEISIHQEQSLEPLQAWLDSINA